MPSFLLSVVFAAARSQTAIRSLALLFALCCAAGGARAEAPALIDLRPDPHPPVSISELDNGPDPPRVVDGVSGMAMWQLDRLHQPDVLPMVVGMTQPNTALGTIGWWSRPLLEGEAELATLIARYQKARADPFGLAQIERQTIDAIAARGRIMRGAKEFIEFWDRLKIGAYDPHQKAFVLAVNPPWPEGAYPQCVVYARGSPNTFACFYVSNLRTVWRPRGFGMQVVEMAPFHYLPFDDEDDARQFNQTVVAGFRAGHVWACLYVRTLGPLEQKAKDPNVALHVDVQITRLAFIDQAGKVLRSFIVPATVHASDGLPIVLPTGGQAAQRARDTEEAAAKQRAKDAAAAMQNSAPPLSPSAGPTPAPAGSRKPVIIYPDGSAR